MSGAPGRRRPLDPNVVTLGAASFLNDASSEMIFPLLPTFLTSVLGAGPAFLGLVEGLADAVSSLLRFFAGWLSDRIGRRKPLVVVGYGLPGLVRPLVAIATAPWHVLVVRVSDRVGKGIRTAPRDALLAESTLASDRGRAFGFHRAMDHAGAVVGPLAASALLLLFDGDYRMLFATAALPGLATVCFVATRVRETRPTPVEAAAPPSPLAALTRIDRRFGGFVAAVLIFSLGNATDAFLLLRLGSAGVDAVWLPLLWSALHVVKVASVYPLGSLSDRVGRLPVILAGWTFYALLYAGLALASSPAVVTALFLGYGLFSGLTEGAERALVGDLVGAGDRGAAFGVYHTVVGVGVLPASLTVGLLWELHGQAAAFAYGAAMAALAAVVLLASEMLARRRAGGRSRRRRPPA